MRLMFGFRSFIPLLAKRNYILNNKYRRLSVRHVPCNLTTENKVSENAKSQFIDDKHIELLQKLSFVEFTNAEGVEIVENAIKFANIILEVNTENVEPMYTVLENRNLTLREDIVTDGNCKDDILKNSSVTEDDYFVVPLGGGPNAS